MSRAFDEVEVRFAFGGLRCSLKCGRASGAPRSGARPGGGEGPVKAGPSGPPVRGSLEGPGQLAPTTMGLRLRTAPLSALGLVDTAVTSPLAPRTGHGRPWGSAARHSFAPAWGMVC